MRSRRAGIGRMLCLLLVLACSGEERRPEPGVPPVPVPEPVVTGDRPIEEALPIGQARLVVEGDRIDLRAHAADRVRVLRELARDLDFELDLRPDGFEWPPLDVELVDQPIGAVLPAVFGEVPFESEYERRGDGDGLRLAVVRAGKPPPPERAEPSGEADLRDVDAGAWAEDRSVAEIVREAIETMHASDPPDDPLALARSPDAADRMRAALWLPPRGEGLATLRTLLHSDPEPAVRAAATASLEESRADDALAALVAALDDPSPDVLVEVIDSIAFAGSEAQLEDLRPFLQHPDSRVREAALAAREFLGADDGPDESAEASPR